MTPGEIAIAALSEIAARGAPRGNRHAEEVLVLATSALERMKAPAASAQEVAQEAAPEAKPLSPDRLNIREASAELKRLAPRYVVRARDFIQASHRAIQATVEAWQMAEWSGAIQQQKDKARRDYLDARSAYHEAEGRFSAALSGGIHESELDPPLRTKM